MDKKGKSLAFLTAIILASVAIALLVSQFSSAVTCGTYTASSTCDTGGCYWRADSWGSWCEEKGCWNYFNSSCPSTIPGSNKNCQWRTSSSSGWCETTSCWSYSGTNQNTCETNPLNLSCQWNAQCQNAGGSSASCWNISSQALCGNTTGCQWGSCMEKGCWSYTTSAACTGQTGSRGKSCQWQSNTWGGWCSEQNCGSYATQATCNSAPASLKCSWGNGYCGETTCYNLGFTNSTNCVNNTYNLSCQWDNTVTSGSRCQEKGCWNYNTQGECGTQSKCSWKTSAMSGRCEEVNCWSWDSWNGGNATSCINNTYNMACAWNGNPQGNATNGWCFRNITTSFSCSNFTTERLCTDTNYCWWQFTNPSNPSAGGNCKTPGEFSGTSTNSSILKEWNPGCYIFDRNQTDCNKVIGCAFQGGRCNTTNATISSSGFTCQYVNDSQLCNSIALLSTCCSWQGSSCAENRFSQTCYTNLPSPPEGAKFCEDYNAYTSSALCNQIANNPWYMPCSWSNSTERCGFKSSDIFGNSTQNIGGIDNKKACEAANGKWVVENYCEGNVSVPSGRCENKFDEERNCDKACYACEYQSDGSAWTSLANAKSACIGSKLGYCDFTASTNAPNGIGFCGAKEQFKKGVTAGNCDSDCGACTFMGNPQAASASNQPQEHCRNSKASCKWMVDNRTQIGGYCVPVSEKTCEDECGKCNSQSDCQNKGRTATNSSMKGACTWDSSKSICSKTGQAGETCWDAADNDADGQIDCADSNCFTDPFCGFTSGSCYGWATNATCASNGCNWATDAWGGWCESPGGQCWKHDGNISSCGNASGCQWTAGTGSGMCEQNWDSAMGCMGHMSSTACTTAGCSWSNDTWCSASGAGSEWCTTQGGWCNSASFASANCYQYDGNQTGCASNNCRWEAMSNPTCNGDYSGNCWQYSNSTACNTTKCAWKTPSGGGSGWCAAKAEQCSGLEQSSCSANTLCRWRTEYWGGTPSSWCESKCFSPNNTASTCSADLGCRWTTGWCNEGGGASAICSTISDSNACMGNTSCKWKSPGWCDPVGFMGAGAAGGSGGMGAGLQCFEYDGTNATFCTNHTGCGWQANSAPQCMVKFGNCWQYFDLGSCSSNNCWWNPTMGPSGSCMNRGEQCGMNASLSSEPACNGNALCAWQGSFCNSKCTSGTVTGANCNSTIGCVWETGICNPSGMVNAFDTMQKGAPTPLGFDETGEIASQSVDMCGFGMKDMGDSFGFGASVKDGMSGASECNSQPYSPSKCPGGSTSSGVGTGNATVEFIVYLDTDGSTSGNCVLDNDATAAGYEFKLRFRSYWNNSKNNELKNAYKCDSGRWAGTDIKVNVWNQIMCSEIGGPMLSVDKPSLAKFPTLYDSTADMRVYAATIGNSSYNSSRPADTIGPAWVTPGSVDFDINDMFQYGADSAKFEDILKKGYMQYEDCFNNIDDNNDGYTDCNDFACQFSSKCTGSGVNAPGYSDTTSPKVTGVKIEEYPDSALIMYDTNKPANGTVLYYGSNDTTCANSVQGYVYDVGLTSVNVRDYKLWHYGRVDNTTIPYSNVSVGQTYYYKLKVCDTNNKCAISKCTSFKTAQTVAKCNYCNFVTRIKAPTGWTVKYDTNRDGAYDHVQGEVCGPNAGMKTNYTLGRLVNILLVSGDNTTYLEFINASLTKTALNDKVRSISDSGSLKNGTTTTSAGATIGYTGMPSETRDKIVNNLHPEVCRIKIPSVGTCSALWHCNDSLGGCTEMTSDATLITTGSNYCVWQVPFCEFSVWAGGQPGTYSSGSSATTSSGGGGGGGAAGGASKETLKAVAVGESMGFTAAGSLHALTLIELTETEAKVLIQSNPIRAVFRQGEEKKFDINEDKTYDALIKLVLINMTARKATFSVKQISEAVPAAPKDVTGKAVSEEEVPSEQPEEPITGDATAPILPPEEMASWLKILLVSTGIAIGVFSTVLAVRSKKKVVAAKTPESHHRKK